MKEIDALRKHLSELLKGRNAHVDIDGALKGLPVKLRGAKAEGSPYTAWQLVEHIRIAQWDILEFSRDAKHVSPEWPSGYWPKSAEPPRAAAWDASIARFEREREAMKKLVLIPKTDLFARIPHGDGQTILREALLVADHTAYHTGQIVLVRSLLGIWGKD